MIVWPKKFPSQWNAQRWRVGPTFVCFSFTKGRTLFLGGSNSSYISGDDLPAIQQYFPNSTVKHIEVRLSLYNFLPYRLLESCHWFVITLQYGLKLYHIKKEMIAFVLTGCRSLGPCGETKGVYGRNYFVSEWLSMCCLQKMNTQSHWFWSNGGWGEARVSRHLKKNWNWTSTGQELVAYVVLQN